MKKQIIPAIIAKNQKELSKRIKKISKQTKIIQLDAMDGKFVKNKSLNFDFKIPKKNYEIQLMVKDPESWINEHALKVKRIIFHIESTKNPKKIINLIKERRKMVGIAINPKTSIKKIKPYLRIVDMILIMTVNPGKYGNKFLPYTIKKIEELRKLKPKMDIEVDGGINDKTISLTSKAGANIFVVGSFLQKSKNPKKSIKKLKELI